MDDDRIRLDNVSLSEAMLVLEERFGGPSETAPHIYRYYIGNTECFIDVTGQNDGRIEITHSLTFPQDTFDRLKAELQNALAKVSGVEVWQVVCFCHERVEGYFRYEDKFQILPLSDDAPRPPISHAEHPFLLQFSYKQSPQHLIAHSRRANKAVTYVRLLNTLANHRIIIDPLVHRTSNHSWVYDMDQIPHATSRYMPRGYVYPTWTPKIDRFTDVTPLAPIGRVPGQTYYRTQPGLTGDPLTLAHDIEKSLDTVFDLGETEWRQFFRAVSWFATAGEIWPLSSSSAFVAHVTAIESLINKEQCPECHQPLSEEFETCNTCGQPRYRVMRRFREFLETHAPFIEQMPHVKKQLYAVRSNLAHGAHMLQIDLEPWAIDHRHWDESELHGQLFTLVRFALYHWLSQRRREVLPR